ncbi:MAG: hypothetical protein ABJA90_11195 [Ginsengibacter sp.]
MNILRLAGEIFLIYILYKLIFDFIIPVYQSTKKIKKQFGEMHSKMQQDMNAYTKSQNPDKTGREASGKDDYIEFEEIKK